MPEFRSDLSNGEINGFYDPKFERVAQEFEKNFREREEVGASVCVTIEGEKVVDLWGGIARESDNTAWGKDTVSIVFSCTKGATALCAHILASRGELDLDAPVVQYWPEFGQAGKEKMKVKHLLNHQSGLSAISKPLPPGAFFDWETMTSALAEQAPFWTPGSAHGYEMITFGWLVGEVVRRVSGKSLGTFFKDEVATPLGLDFWIGLPEEHEHRVASMIAAPPPDPTKPLSLFFLTMVSDPGSIQFLALLNSGGYWSADPNVAPLYDSREAHAAEIGAAGGVTNARGLAGMYAPLACGGSFDGVKLVDADTLVRMGTTSSASSVDRMLLVPSRFALGYFKSVDNRREDSNSNDSAIIAEEAFGHPGAGGSIGFADPKARMSFGYTMNKMGEGVALNERGQSLVDATYLSLGYTSNKGGSWIK